MSEWKDIRDTVLDEAVVSLFEAYQQCAIYVEAPTVATAQPLVSVVGFTGDQLRGSMAIITTEEVVRATSTSTLCDEVQTSDWLAELSNQLLGRFKNRIRRHGAVLNISTPVVMSGTELRLHPQLKTSDTRYYETTAGPVSVILNVELDEQFTVRECSPSTAPNMISEGELMLF